MERSRAWRILSRIFKQTRFRKLKSAKHGCLALSKNFPWLLCENDAIAFLQRHDGLLPIVRLTRLCRALPARFTSDVQRVDAEHFDFEKLLHRLANLDFVRTRISHDRGLVQFLALARALLSDAHGFDDVESVHVISEDVLRAFETHPV